MGKLDRSASYPIYFHDELINIQKNNNFSSPLDQQALKTRLQIGVPGLPAVTPEAVAG